MAYGFPAPKRFVFGMAVVLSTTLVLTAAGESVNAQEPAAQNRMTPAKRQAVFKARLVDIEDLFTSGATEDEARDYIERLRRLADLAEASQTDKAARLDLLRRKLARVRASMGGAVEAPDERSRALYESMMIRLRAEEESILREISETERK